MTWQLATFVGLGLVLVGGFVWYERARPPARLVALVAALAALAVAGRLVLTPIPNVVATTDIALITGYALGGAPGFAVGALAAPVSNIWLGQGPWTAWEMAGWGLVGLGGALLAATWGRGIGRFGLAVACGAAGLAYGALLDLSVMVTYGGEQSLDRYLALSARGIPFNVAHAAGNVAIALAAGPALVRLISRYRTRFEFTWRPAAALPAAVLAVVIAGGAMAWSGPAAAAPAKAAGAKSARAYLEQSQADDGGFGASPSYRSSPAMTGWAILGLEAAGRNPRDVRRGGRTPVDYLRSRADRLRSTGDLERTILALEAAGLSSRRFAGNDLVAELRLRRTGDGSFSGQVNLTAFGVLALRAAGLSGGALAGPAGWLREAQNDDGGWGFGPQATSDPDSTGAALQALAVAGGGGALSAGVDYLRRTQRPDGGWGLNETGVTNTQSTAWAVQGLVAARVRPGGVRERGHSPLDFLAARQVGDGHYRYSASTDQTPIWVTSQALLAVRQRAFPLAVVSRSPREHGARGGRQSEEDVPILAPTAGGSDAGSDRRSAQRDDGNRKRRTSTGADRRDTSRAPGSVKPATEEPASLIGTPASSPVESEQEEGLGAAAYVGGGLGLLALALGAGFLWYRRKLP